LQNAGRPGGTTGGFPGSGAPSSGVTADTQFPSGGSIRPSQPDREYLPPYTG
jgi:hypothetical protein